MSRKTRTRKTPERSGYLGLGSNMGDRLGHLRAALEALPSHGVEIEAASSVYETEPHSEEVDEADMAEQADFLNACVRIRTPLEPEALLDVCKAIEVEQGRMFGGPRHGPRPLDVDVLTLDATELESEKLTIPHPRLTSRRFVLEPLLELDPKLELPDGTRLADCLDGLPEAEQRVRRLGLLA